jgi:hypothetical protein
MNQAGVKSITLYENKSIAFRFYNPLDTNSITDLTCAGAIIEILNECQPEFDIDIKIADSGQVTYDYTLKFFLFALTQNTLNELIQLITSIRGWCFLAEFYDGTKKFYNTALRTKASKIKPHKEMVFEVEMITVVPSIKKHLDLVSGISSVPVYRADTTLLTADTEIYTADYGL